MSHCGHHAPVLVNTDPEFVTVVSVDDVVVEIVQVVTPLAMTSFT